jgi:O-acetyl-ADP-ribose deacetylase (regulator of RNase III)
VSLRYVTGDLLDDDAECLVNCVNCVGVMGSGIAAKFKQMFPQNYLLYREHCAAKRLQPGDVLVCSGDGRFIFNAATKDHWREPSCLEWVETALNNINFKVHQRGIKSIAVPALGCGKGRLEWADVQPLIYHYMNIADVVTRVYLPQEAT